MPIWIARLAASPATTAGLAPQTTTGQACLAEHVRFDRDSLAFLIREASRETATRWIRWIRLGLQLRVVVFLVREAFAQLSQPLRLFVTDGTAISSVAAHC